MNEDNVIETAKNAFKRKHPSDFLWFLKTYRRPYDEGRVKRELDRLEQMALERI